MSIEICNESGVQIQWMLIEPQLCESHNLVNLDIISDCARNTSLGKACTSQSILHTRPKTAHYVTFTKSSRHYIHKTSINRPAKSETDSAPTAAVRPAPDGHIPGAVVEISAFLPPSGLLRQVVTFELSQQRKGPSVSLFPGMSGTHCSFAEQYWPRPLVAQHTAEEGTQPEPQAIEPLGQHVVLLLLLSSSSSLPLPPLLPPRRFGSRRARSA